MCMWVGLYTGSMGMLSRYMLALGERHMNLKCTSALCANYMYFQAFKLVVTDPDSVLSGLTREIKEIGPDGQEVSFLLETLHFLPDMDNRNPTKWEIAGY